MGGVGAKKKKIPQCVFGVHGKDDDTSQRTGPLEKKSGSNTEVHTPWCRSQKTSGALWNQETRKNRQFDSCVVAACVKLRHWCQKLLPKMGKRSKVDPQEDQSLFIAFLLWPVQKGIDVAVEFLSWSPCPSAVLPVLSMVFSTLLRVISVLCTTRSLSVPICGWLRRPRAHLPVCGSKLPLVFRHVILALSFFVFRLSRMFLWTTCVLGWYSLPATRTPVVRVSRYSVLSLLVSFPRCENSYSLEVAFCVAATIIPHRCLVQCSWQLVPNAAKVKFWSASASFFGDRGVACSDEACILASALS